MFDLDKPNPVTIAATAMITGVFLGIALGSSAAILGWSRPWAWGLAGLALSSAGSWLVFVRWWQRFLEGMHQITTQTQKISIESGARAEAHATVRVELIQGSRGDYLDLPITHVAMVAVSRELVAREFSTSNLGGAGKVVTRSQAEALRDYLIGRELAVWLRPGSPTVGWVLLAAGRGLIRKYADLPKHNPPQLQDGIIEGRFVE